MCILDTERKREMVSISADVKPHIFHVSFVKYDHKRLLRSRGPNSFDGFSGFNFETIPDGLSPLDADVSQDIPSLAKSLPKTCLVPLCNLITKLNDTSSSNVPPVTTIIADGCMSCWQV